MLSFEGMISEFEEKSTESGKALEENEAGARKEGLKEKEALKGDGSEQEKAMIRDATSQASEKMDQARDEITRSFVSAQQSLEKELAFFSKELAEKILGRNI
jgi:F0F1-type ATP synthase membrane subunit b/b'